MSCDDMKILMIDSLYQEISPPDAARLEEHLQGCQSCQAEFSALTSTSRLLQKWPDLDPNMHIVFMTGSQSWLKKFFSFLPVRKLAYGFAVAAAIIFMVLTIANSNVQYQNGNWDIQLGLARRPASAPPIYATRAELLQTQNENILLIRQLLEANNLEQQQLVQRTLAQLALDLEQRRRQDLSLVARSLDNVHYGAKIRLDRTDQVLNNLIRLTAYPMPEK